MDTHTMIVIVLFLFFAFFLALVWLISHTREDAVFSAKVCRPSQRKPPIVIVSHHSPDASL